MKTPRDILYERHQAATPKLDAIRQAVVRELNNQTTKGESFSHLLVSKIFGFPNKLWLELVLPCRRIWLGLAIVWVLLFIVNFAQRDTPQSATVRLTPSADMMMTYRDQERMLNELLANRSYPIRILRVPNNAPARNPEPRSEMSEIIAV